MSITIDEINALKEKLAVATSKFDKAQGVLENVKEQALKFPKIKEAVDGGLTLGAALQQEASSLEAEVERLNSEIEVQVSEFREKYSTLLENIHA